MSLTCWFLDFLSRFQIFTQPFFHRFLDGLKDVICMFSERYVQELSQGCEWNEWKLIKLDEYKWKLLKGREKKSDEMENMDKE